MSTDQLKNSLRLAGIGFGLALGTLFLYWPVVHHGFITLDDNLYVTANPQVQAGLTWAGAQWAFTNTFASNWHPLTWLSHMTDCQMFGLHPAGHHLTNVFFHIANMLLLFAWLNGATGAVWRSAFVAALFAWHPLHVESVAWVAERKDVLSVFFWLLALLAYTRYVKRPGLSAYLLVLFLFLCGLMSKPMLVTLPFVLLLADFWPLGRVAGCRLQVANSAAFNFQPLIFNRLLIEKIPFLAMSVAAGIVNYIAQKAGGATWSPDILPLHIRIANALVSYVRYLSKTFWPVDLAVIYPYQKHWPFWFVFTAAALLLTWSAMVVWRARKTPYLFFGWFYFVGTLVPAIGLVQVGPQAMADRYMYLPSIGLFILLVWGVNELLTGQPHRKKIAALAGTTALCACIITASLQLSYWQNSVKLLLHTVEVTTDNYTADAYLGGALEAAGLNDAALPFYVESVRITPYFPIAQWNLGLALLRKGQFAEASEHLAAAAQLTPNDPVIHCYYGKALAAAGNLETADTQFTEALRLKPGYAEAHLFLAISLARQKKFAAAIPQFAAVAELEPDNPDLHFNFGLALLDNHQPDAAAAQFTQELRLQPDEAKTHYRLALALQQQNKPAEAVMHFRQALKLAPELSEARTALDTIFSAHPELK
jgi:tetratricopeptide (TPR) repeat protein